MVAAVAGEVVTGEAVVLDIRAARLPSRALALLVDRLIQVAALAAVSLLAAGVAQAADPALTAAVGLVLAVLVVVGYPAILESLWRGRTPGKAAMGLRVVADDGGPERFRQALFRALAALVETWLFLGIPAVVASLASQQGRRLGDIFAGTVVVRERTPAPDAPAATMPPQLASWAAGLELSGLSDEVALTARQYAARYHELAPQARHEMGSRIAAAMARGVAPPPPEGTPPEAYVFAVLAERRRRAAHSDGARSGHQPPAHPGGQPPRGGGPGEPPSAGSGGFASPA